MIENKHKTPDPDKDTFDDFLDYLGEQEGKELTVQQRTELAQNARREFPQLGLDVDDDNAQKKASHSGESELVEDDSRIIILNHVKHDEQARKTIYIQGAVEKHIIQ